MCIVVYVYVSRSFCVLGLGIPLFVVRIPFERLEGGGDFGLTQGDFFHYKKYMQNKPFINKHIN